jgi:hypothetical protein
MVAFKAELSSFILPLLTRTAALYGDCKEYGTMIMINYTVGSHPFHLSSKEAEPRRSQCLFQPILEQRLAAADGR